MRPNEKYILRWILQIDKKSLGNFKQKYLFQLDERKVRIRIIVYRLPVHIYFRRKYTYIYIY